MNKLAHTDTGNHTISMSEFSPSAVAATAAPSSGEHLGGLDIAEIMSSQGPVVKCVVLRAAPRADAPSSSSPQCDNDSGQKDASSLSVKEMKRELSRHGVNTAAFVEKRELVAALEEARRGAAPLGGERSCFRRRRRRRSAEHRLSLAGRHSMHISFLIPAVPLTVAVCDCPSHFPVAVDPLRMKVSVVIGLDSGGGSRWTVTSGDFCVVGGAAAGGARWSSSPLLDEL